MATSFFKTISTTQGLPETPVPASGGSVTWLITVDSIGHNEIGSITKDVDFQITDLVSSISPAIVTDFSWTTDIPFNQGAVVTPGPAAGSGDINFQFTGPIPTDLSGNWGFAIEVTATLGPSVGPSNSVPGLQLSENTASVVVNDDGYGEQFQGSSNGFVYQAINVETGETCCGFNVREGWVHEEYGYNDGGYGHRFHTCIPTGVNDGWQPLGT